MRSFAIACALLLILAATALAQPEKYDAGVFADLNGTQTSIGVPTLVPFELYGLAYDVDGVLAHEAGAYFEAPVVVVATSYNPPTVLCIDCSYDNWVIGAQFCIATAPQTWFRMITWTCLLAAPWSDVKVCLTPHEPSGFMPPAPGYVQCDGTPQAFGVAENGGLPYPDGCLVVNPTQEPPIANGNESWGSVKARY